MTPSKTIVASTYSINKRSHFRSNAPNDKCFGKRLDENSILIVDKSFNSLFLFLSLNFSLEIDLISIGLSSHLILYKISPLDNETFTPLTISDLYNL